MLCVATVHLDVWLHGGSCGLVATVEHSGHFAWPSLMPHSRLFCVCTRVCLLCLCVHVHSVGSWRKRRRKRMRSSGGSEPLLSLVILLSLVFLLSLLSCPMRPSVPCVPSVLKLVVCGLWLAPDRSNRLRALAAPCTCHDMRHRVLISGRTSYAGYQRSGWSGHLQDALLPYALIHACTPSQGDRARLWRLGSRRSLRSCQLALLTHSLAHVAPWLHNTRGRPAHVPFSPESWAEEIGLEISMLKFLTSFYWSPHNFQTSFHGSPQNFEQNFTGVNGSPCHSKEWTGKLSNPEIQIF